MCNDYFLPAQSVGDFFFRDKSVFILGVQYSVITSDQHCKTIYMKKDSFGVVGVRAPKKTHGCVHSRLISRRFINRQQRI